MKQKQGLILSAACSRTLARHYRAVRQPVDFSTNADDVAEQTQVKAQVDAVTDSLSELECSAGKQMPDGRIFRPTETEAGYQALVQAVAARQ